MDEQILDGVPQPSTPMQLVGRMDDTGDRPVDFWFERDLMRKESLMSLKFKETFMWVIVSTATLFQRHPKAMGDSLKRYPQNGSG